MYHDLFPMVFNPVSNGFPWSKAPLVRIAAELPDEPQGIELQQAPGDSVIDLYTIQNGI